VINKLYIKNFRSIQDAEIPLGKMTVLTGANNSGKSSVIYALLVLKELIRNPAREVDKLFNLPFANLGNFKNVVFQQKTENVLSVGLETTENKVSSKYNVEFHSDNKITISSSLQNEEQPLAFMLSINLPFDNPNMNEFIISIENSQIKLLWDGLSGPVFSHSPEKGTLIHSDKIRGIFYDKIARPVVAPIREAFTVDSSVPYSRGFTKSNFAAIPLQHQITTEDEIATLLAKDSETQSKVAHYLKKIIPFKIFRVHTTLGTALFRLQLQDEENGILTDLVNEGTGLNQIISLLTKILYSQNSFICIDEPEIHLHPSLINRLVDVLFKIIEKENKQLLITTHSEHFISAILRNVANKTIKPNHAKIYYLKKENDATIFEHQAINDKGQISGGLKSFYEGELKAFENIFKIKDKS